MELVGGSVVRVVSGSGMYYIGVQADSLRLGRCNSVDGIGSLKREGE